MSRWAACSRVFIKAEKVECNVPLWDCRVLVPSINIWKVSPWKGDWLTVNAYAPVTEKRCSLIWRSVVEHRISFHCGFLVSKVRAEYRKCNIKLKLTMRPQWLSCSMFHTWLVKQVSRRVSFLFKYSTMSITLIGQESSVQPANNSFMVSLWPNVTTWMLRLSRFSEKQTEKKRRTWLDIHPVKVSVQRYEYSTR